MGEETHKVEFLIANNNHDDCPFDVGEVFNMTPERNDEGVIVAGHIDKNGMLYYILMNDCCFGAWELIEEPYYTKCTGSKSHDDLWKSIQAACKH